MSSYGGLYDENAVISYSKINEVSDEITKFVMEQLNIQLEMIYSIGKCKKSPKEEDISIRANHKVKKVVSKSDRSSDELINKSLQGFPDPVLADESRSDIIELFDSNTGRMAEGMEKWL